VDERTCAMRAVHSGQEVVNPDDEPVLLLIRRCHGWSPHQLTAIAQRRRAPCSCVAFHRSTAKAMAPGHQRPLARSVPTHELDERGSGAARGGASEAPVLEVRCVFETSRLGSACLAAAYAQVVSGHQRRVGREGQISSAPTVDARQPKAVGMSGGIRDV
jgi:hypothetical protein